MDKFDTLPEIDYLSRDYASFRQLILDHLSVLVPDWTERHPADIGNVIVEVLAYAADYLSYYQDAVATEAYLGTARLRRSVQRHVRLLDYEWHEGCNARVWVHIQVRAQGSPQSTDSRMTSGTTEEDSPQGVFLPKSTPLLTRLKTGGTITVIRSPAAYAAALLQNPLVFETMHNATLYEAHNEIHFYTDDPPPASLAVGAITATLLDDPQQKLMLKVGDVLIFEEVRNPTAGIGTGPDITHRAAVRLTKITPGHKENTPVMDIEWASADALTFPLVLTAPSGGGRPIDVSVARGNIVLADHGRTITDELLPAIPASGRYYPPLRQKGLTFRIPYEARPSATATLVQDPRDALPAISLLELGKRPIKPAAGAGSLLLPTKAIENMESDGVKTGIYPIKEWHLRSELLSSGTFARDYAVEVEEDGRAYLRFGYGTVGWHPAVAGDHCVATYRVGLGTIGNIGPEAIAHIVTADDRIAGVCNPLAAEGGQDPCAVEKARLHAPSAIFATVERCVTEDDYVTVVERYPGVARAVAQHHWMSGGNSTAIYVQRHANLPVDADPAFQSELRDWLEPFRLAGCKIEITDARFVPVQVQLRVYLKPVHRPDVVGAQITETFFGTSMASDGTRGFFQSDNFSFGKPVYRSQVISRAMQVPGVARVDLVAFRRMDSPVDAGNLIPIGPLEIARLDNDPNHPLQGVFNVSFILGNL